MKGNVENFEPRKNRFDSIYRGVIEDRNDPLKMGRAKIRIWGIHSEIKTPTTTDGIRVEDLPWASPCMSLIEGSISGFGLFSVPLNGSHVFVFFENGNWECPVYFATIPSIPTEKANASIGFNDPDGIYPKEDKLNESDFSRLARAEKIENTVVQYKKDNLDTGVPTVNGSWDEPEPFYAAKYPDNIVLATHSGIVIEYDNTIDAERIHIYHPSNTYIEIGPDGKMIIKNTDDKFEICMKNHNTHVMLDKHTTVDRDNQQYTKGDEFRKIDGDLDDSIAGKAQIAIEGDLKEDIGGKVVITVGGDAKIDVGGNLDITAGGVGTLKATTWAIN